MTNDRFFPGLKGVVGGETEISAHQTQALYRGYRVIDLVECSSFKESAYLILYGQLPSEEQLADFSALMSDAAEITPDYREFLQQIPPQVSLGNVMQMAMPLLAARDQSIESLNTREKQIEIGQKLSLKLLARLPQITADRYASTQGMKSGPFRFDLSFAENLFVQFQCRHQIPTHHEQALEAALVILCDPAFDASTFSARLAASTGANLYACLSAALGTFNGQMMISGIEAVHQFLDLIDSPSDTKQVVKTFYHQQRQIPGFARRVDHSYNDRERLLTRICQKLAVEMGAEELEQTADAVEKYAYDEALLIPNENWVLARLFHYLGFDRQVHPALAAIGRICGWCAHIFEQYGSDRPYSPDLRYRGHAPIEFEPLEIRE